MAAVAKKRKGGADSSEEEAAPAGPGGGGGGHQEKEPDSKPMFLVQRYDNKFLRFPEGSDYFEQIHAWSDVKLALCPTQTAADSVCSADKTGYMSRPDIESVYVVSEIQPDTFAREPVMRLWPSGNRAKFCEECLRPTDKLFKTSDDAYKRCGACSDVEEVD